MPYGPGTYGSEVGRPPKKIKRKKKPAKKSIRETSNGKETFKGTS